MTNEDTRRPLITRLINGLIDDERSLELDSVALVRRVNWRAKVDINDMGKVIGRQAAHLYSLRVLLNLMGAKFGEDWRLEVTDPDAGDRVDKGMVPAAKSYDPRPTRDLICEIMEATGHDAFTVEIQTTTKSESSPDHRLEYKFIIRPATRSDLELLLTKVTVGRVELTPVAALGTIFRAYGRQQGVSFTIEVPNK